HPRSPLPYTTLFRSSVMGGLGAVFSPFSVWPAAASLGPESSPQKTGASKAALVRYRQWAVRLNGKSIPDIWSFQHAQRFWVWASDRKSTRLNSSHVK